MAQVAGITIDRTLRGKPTFVRIDLRRHAHLIPVLEDNGVELDPPIKWTAKMKRSFAQAKNGETVLGDINNFWNV